jgi:uncharacterized membrane-anchored protein
MKTLSNKSSSASSLNKAEFLDTEHCPTHKAQHEINKGDYALVVDFQRHQQADWVHIYVEEHARVKGCKGKYISFTLDGEQWEQLKTILG